MLMIIAHHYVVNSGLNTFYDFKNITGNMIFLQLFGFGGKTGINCFLLITGYFMCKQDFSFKKLLKLYIEIKFYTFLFYFIFLASGYEPFSFKELFKTVFNVAYWMNNGFTGTFIALYLIIPFLNILIRNINQKSHSTLIGLLVFIYTITSTFFYNWTYEYLGWYTTIYIIGAYIRIYENKVFTNLNLSISLSIVTLILAWLSIIIIDYFAPTTQSGQIPYYYFVSDSNKILALLCSISFFMLFKNITIKQNMILNTIAASTFGILLIHANSDTMRKFLWKDLLDNASFYNSSYLAIHAICSVVCVYIVCFAIDYCRIRFIETPLFNNIDRNEEKLFDYYLKFKAKFTN